MTQTVKAIVNMCESEHFFLAMPDTYFFGSEPYSILDPEPHVADLALWKIRPEQKGKLGQVSIVNSMVVSIQDKNPLCEFEYSWGALTFHRDLLKYSSTNDPHIGYALQKAVDLNAEITGKIINGSYFDCGTPTEYLEMIQQVIKATE
jgi:hypothetical protein